MNILEEALKATDGDRPSQYGHPREHFKRTVALVNAHFAHKLREPLVVDDWPVLMILDKLARLAHRGQRDSLVDVAGYARTLEMVQEARAVQPVPAPKDPGHATGVDTRGQVPGNGHALEACPDRAEPQADGHP